MPHGDPGHAAGRNPLLHARALPVYGGSPLPQAGHADFCVGHDNFTLPATQSCHRGGQKIARFTAVKPTETEKGLVAYLAEEAEYNDEQARDAGIQRLLTIAGYDAGPIDGVRGEKTDAALAQFIADNKLENTAAGRADFFDAADGRCAKAEQRRLRLVQRDAQRRDGGARLRGPGHGRHPRLVSRRARQMPAARPHRQAAPALQLRRGRRRRRPAARGAGNDRGQSRPGAARPSYARATSSSS